MNFKKNLETKLKSPIANIRDSSDYEQIIRKKKKVNMGDDKSKLNFPLENECFSSSDIPLRAKEAKNELRTFLNPDILEQGQKKWDISVLENKGQFKTTLFEVRHGLKDYKLTRVKENKVELGTDSRNSCYQGWNISNAFERAEIRKIDHKAQEKCSRNTLLFWKKENQGNENESMNKSLEGDLGTNEPLSIKNANQTSLTMKYINPTLQMAKEVEEMREKKRATAIMRNDYRRRYNYICLYINHLV